MSKRVTDNFRVKVRDWIAYDNKIIKASNAIKRVKEKESEIGTGILSFMDHNGLQRKEIKINNCRLQYKTARKITPLTKKFILTSLTEELDDEHEAKEIVKILYDPRKRMEICLTHYFDDEDVLVNRNSFVFYDSFYKAMKNLSKDEKIEYIDAICNYSLYDIRLEMCPKIEGMFELIKAQIDANIKKRKDGMKGGRPSNRE